MSNSAGTMLRQFMTFAALGVVGTMAHYVTLFVCVEAFGLDPVLASTVGFVVGALVNYYLSRAYVFRSSVSHVTGVPKFFTVAIIGMILNASIMSLIMFLIKTHYIVAQLIATGFVLIWNFFGNRFWTFAPDDKRRSEKV